jgi:hypothetical protein
MINFGKDIQVIGIEPVSKRRHIGNLDYVSDIEKNIISVLKELGGAAIRRDIDNKLINTAPCKSSLSRYYHRLYIRGWIDIYVLYQPYQPNGKGVFRGIALKDGVAI